MNNMNTKKLAIAILFLYTITAVKAQSNTLENKNFWITSYNEKGKEDNNEYLIFQNKKVIGSECIKYGFNAAIYTIEDNDFVATMTHEKGGDMIWRGTVDYKTKTMQGNVVWTSGKGERTHYTFKGYQTKNTTTKNKL